MQSQEAFRRLKSTSIDGAKVRKGNVPNRKRGCHQRQLTSRQSGTAGRLQMRDQSLRSSPPCRPAQAQTTARCRSPPATPARTAPRPMCTLARSCSPPLPRTHVPSASSCTRPQTRSRTLQARSTCQSGTAKRHRSIHGQDTPLEHRKHPISHPSPQDGALRAVTPFHLLDAHLEFQKCDGGQKQR